MSAAATNAAMKRFAIAATLALFASAGHSAERTALDILRGLAAGEALAAEDVETLERSYVVSKLSRNEQIAIRERIYREGLRLPGGIETAIIAANPKRVNNR